MSKLKKYLLNNGEFVTVEDVVKKVGCSLTTARTRLCRTDDHKRIFAQKVYRTGGTRYNKVYVLDDGTKITSCELAEKTGMSIGSARYKLCTYTDPTKVFNLLEWGNGEALMNKKIYAERPINDPMFRLAMMTI